MEDAVGNMDLKGLTQRRLNFIDGSVSSYCSIINSYERLEQMRQEKKLAYILYDLESECMR